MTTRNLLRVWSMLPVAITAAFAGTHGAGITLAILGVAYGSTEIVCRCLGAPGPLGVLFRRDQERLPQATVRRLGP